VDILAQEQRDQVARALALAFPGRSPQWRYENLLLLYSGGTAPDSHRLPHFAMLFSFQNERTLVSRREGVKVGIGQRWVKGSIHAAGFYGVCVGWPAG
jgi:hypothetical protein